MTDYTAPAAAVADALTAAVDRKLASAADCGIGTVTALTPGGIAGTVAVDTGSGASVTMRRNAGYSPTVADKVKWSRSAAGDWFCDYKLA